MLARPTSIRLVPLMAALAGACILPLTGCSRQAPSPDAAAGEEKTLILHAVSHDDFNQMVLSSPVPVLVDFWAPWCPPCRMMEPVLADLAVKGEGVLRIVKVNTDDAPALGQRFNIRALPTMMLVRDGRTVAMREGAMRQASLEEWIGQQLGITLAAEAATP